MTDREWLLKLADMLTQGAGFFEEPEGTRWIQISNESSLEMAGRLRAIAEGMEVKDA